MIEIVHHPLQAIPQPVFALVQNVYLRVIFNYYSTKLFKVILVHKPQTLHQIVKLAELIFDFNTFSQKKPKIFFLSP